jgi:excisionase family DNA binding protein
MTDMDAIAKQVETSPVKPPETVLPPRDHSVLDELLRFLQAHQSEGILVAPGGEEQTRIPAEVYHILREVVTVMGTGQAITIAPVSQRLTTSQAAELLGISRPTLIALLDDGEIPYERPRRHRLLRLDDVLSYRERQRKNRRELLREMTRQAAADGLYDMSAQDYNEALREARRGL